MQSPAAEGGLLKTGNVEEADAVARRCPA